MENKINIIEMLLLQIQIIKIQIAILLLKKKLTIPNLPKSKYVVIHNGGGNWNFEQVNRHHTNKWGFISSLGYGIGYAKWIAFSGALTVGRRDNERQAHCVDPNNPNFWNINATSICLQGNCDIEEPTEFQKMILRQELDYYRKRGIIIKTHREITNTRCPGRYLQEFIDDYRMSWCLEK